MMNHEKARKLIKMGELKAILNNIDADGKIKNNCIALAKNDSVLLRTNGVVVYGLYDTTKQGNFGTRSKNLIQFTHDLISKDPYVNTTDYVTYKPLVLKAYREVFDDEAKTKLEAVRYIIVNHKWYKEQLAKAQANQAVKAPAKVQVEVPVNNEPTVATAGQEAAVTTQETKIIRKKEVSNMNTELNTMALAHKIRRELGLEGDYRAQMKMAMTYAWAIKKGTKSLEDILGSTEAADHTYNVANPTGEQESAMCSIVEEEAMEAKVETAEAVIEAKVEAPSNNEDKHEFEFMMHKVKDGFQLGLTQLSNGKVKMVGKVINTPNIAAAYLYVGKNIEKIVNVLPNNTKLFALPLTISACKTRAGLKDICKSKHLTYEAVNSNTMKEMMAKVSPSGDAV